MCIKFEWNLSSGIRNKLRTNCVYGQTDGRTDGQTDGQGDSNIPIYFVAGGIITWIDITYIIIKIWEKKSSKYAREYCLRAHKKWLFWINRHGVLQRKFKRCLPKILGLLWLMSWGDGIWIMVWLHHVMNECKHCDCKKIIKSRKCGC
jgi:hypothetical protein